MSNPKEQSIGLTIEQLKEIMTAVVAEARKPVVTEKELRELEQQNLERKANAVLVKEQRENTQQLRKMCSHCRRDGSTRAVYIKGSGADSGNFLICQYCQAIIRPGTAPAGYSGSDLYDNELFNRLFQLAGAADFIE